MAGDDDLNRVDDRVDGGDRPDLLDRPGQADQSERSGEPDLTGEPWQPTPLGESAGAAESERALAAAVAAAASSASAAASGPEDLIARRYRLVRHIGSGGMGVVWQAKDEILGRTVALKELSATAGQSLNGTGPDGAARRAMREARIAARLHHPNVIAVYDVVQHGGRPWLVMEYLASRSLADVMAESGTLPVDEVARIGAVLASALTAAHDAGIVHRDVKPANVLISDDGAVKLTDFGISRATGDTTVTGTGVVLGTVSYIAPEVARGKPADARSDVYSLGATLYAAVEGQPPFGFDDNAIALLYRIAHEEIIPAQRAGALDSVLLWMLERDPERRPTTRQITRTLEDIGISRRAETAVAAAPAAAPGAAAPASAPAAAPAPPEVAPEPAAKVAVAPVVPAAEAKKAAKAAKAARVAAAKAAKAAPAPVPPAAPVVAAAVAAAALDAQEAPKAAAPSETADEKPVKAADETPDKTPDKAPSPKPSPAPAPAPVPVRAAKEDKPSPEPPGEKTYHVAGTGTAGPAGQTTRYRPAVPSSAPDSGRRRAIIVGTLATLVLIAGTILLIQNTGGNGAAAGSPPASASAGRSPLPSPSATPDQSATASQSPSPTATQTAPGVPVSATTPAQSPPQSVASQLTSTITQYYQLMPGNTNAGWNYMTPDYQQNHAGGRSNYDAFWAAVQSVSLTDVSASPPSTVLATIHYVNKNGSTAVERTSFGMVQEQGGWKIASSSVLSHQGG